MKSRGLKSYTMKEFLVAIHSKELVQLVFGLAAQIWRGAYKHAKQP